MRRIIAGVFLGLWGSVHALAQTTTTTVVGTSSTAIVTSTFTSTSSSSSSSTSSTICTGAACTNYDPRQCARTSDSKEDCREDCCTAGFDELVGTCDGDACGGDWDDFVEEWQRAGQFYKYCQNTDADTEFTEEQIGQKFVEFNVDDSCRAYRFGCKKAARKHVRQCADAGRCVACCRTVLRRWRARAVRDVKQGGVGASCRKGIRCLRRATRKTEACRGACRRRPTCGESAFRQCLEATPSGREVLACYAKCADKCGNANSYRWCLQACQGLGDCAAVDACSETFGATTSPRCLTRGPGDCVGVTTSSTSTSSSTSSTARSTTSTSSSTTTSSPLLVGPRLR